MILSHQERYRKLACAVDSSAFTLHASELLADLTSAIKATKKANLNQSKVSHFVEQVPDNT